MIHLIPKVKLQHALTECLVSIAILVIDLQSELVALVQTLHCLCNLARMGDRTGRKMVAI